VEKIIKTRCGCRVVIHTNHYGHSWRHLSGLVAIAKKDFPALTDDDIEVIVLGGRNRYIWGIEFGISPTEHLPENYEAVEEFDRLVCG